MQVLVMQPVEMRLQQTLRRARHLVEYLVAAVLQRLAIGIVAVDRLLAAQTAVIAQRLERRQAVLGERARQLPRQ